MFLNVTRYESLCFSLLVGRQLLNLTLTMQLGPVWAVNTHQKQILVLSLFIHPESLCMDFLDVVVSVFLQSIPKTVPKELSSWSLSCVAVVKDNKHSVQVSIATPHDPNCNCLIRNRCCKPPDIKVALRAKQEKNAL